MVRGQLGTGERPDPAESPAAPLRLRSSEGGWAGHHLLALKSRSLRPPSPTPGCTGAAPRLPMGSQRSSELGARPAPPCKCRRLSSALLLRVSFLLDISLLLGGKKKPAVGLRFSHLCGEIMRRAKRPQESVRRRSRQEAVRATRQSSRTFLRAEKAFPVTEMTQSASLTLQT